MEQFVDEIRRGYRRYDPRMGPIDPRVPLMPEMGVLDVDGIPFDCLENDGIASPLLLGSGREEALIPIDADISAIAVLGHTAIKGGYPSSSIFSVHHRDAERLVRLGEPAAEYELIFEDSSHTQPLRHGLEISRSNEICRWWTSGRGTPYTRLALRCVVNPSYEILCVDLWEKTVEPGARLKAIRWRLLDENAILAMYALSVMTNED